MLKENYTLVIQGKLHEHTIRMCNLHKDMKTVVSTWGTVEDAEKFLKPALRSNLNIVANPLPEIYDGINNNANRYYQFKSALYGLGLVDTEFVIKARTDEYYSNLEPIINTSYASPKKFITNDVFFRKTEFYEYHPSDHLIAGKTEYMISVYKDCINKCRETQSTRFVPEQQMAISFIAQRTYGDGASYMDLPKGTECRKEVKQLMIDHFDIISSTELGEFCVTANCFNRQWKNTTYVDSNIDAHTSHSLAQEL